MPAWGIFKPKVGSLKNKDHKLKKKHNFKLLQSLQFTLHCGLKFIYSEKATEFEEIFLLILTNFYVTNNVKTKRVISSSLNGLLWNF